MAKNNIKHKITMSRKKGKIKWRTKNIDPLVGVPMFISKNDIKSINHLEAWLAIQKGFDIPNPAFRSTRVQPECRQ